VRSTEAWLAIAAGVGDRGWSRWIAAVSVAHLALVRFAGAMMPRAPRGPSLTSNHVGSRSAIFVWNGSTLRAPQPTNEGSIAGPFMPCSPEAGVVDPRAPCAAPPSSLDAARVGGGKLRCTWHHPDRHGSTRREAPGGAEQGTRGVARDPIGVAMARGKAGEPAGRNGPR
jgi:hypothetical protein